MVTLLPPEQPIPMLKHPFSEKILPDLPNLSPPGCSFRSFPLILSHVAWEQSLTPTLFAGIRGALVSTVTGLAELLDHPETETYAGLDINSPIHCTKPTLTIY